MDIESRNYLDKLKARAEEIYEEMYEAGGPTAAGAYFGEVKEILNQANKLAKEMGLEEEAAEILNKLEHIRSVYKSQMQ